MSLCAEHTEYLWAGNLPELLDLIKKQWGIDLGITMPANVTMEASFWLSDGSISIQPSLRYLEKQYWIASFMSQERLTGDSSDRVYVQQVKASNALRLLAVENTIAVEADRL
jgi:hypothetical protein